MAHEGPKRKEKSEPLLPVGKSVEDILFSTEAEMEGYAAGMGVSVDKLQELLIRASERKQEALEVALAKKTNVIKPVDERAEAVRQGILEVIRGLDFFSLSQIPGNPEELEDKAFSYLNKLYDEKDEQQRKAQRSFAETYFRESHKARAGMRASELMREGKSQSDALAQVAKEMYEKSEGDNVQERRDAAYEVANLVRSRSYNTEMYQGLENLRQAYESGNPSEKDAELMRKLALAARGTYLREAADYGMMEMYGVRQFAPLIRSLGRAYGKAAGFDLSQNQGALGSIERFQIDAPNSYDSDGSPRSRPRRSSIPEERY